MAFPGRLPETIGDFRMRRLIGQGGMGIVFEAEQISLGRRVALKLLTPAFSIDDGKVERFQREARSMGSLTHPNLVPVYQVGEENGLHWFAMGLVEGPSLDELLGGMRLISRDRFEGAHIRRVLGDRLSTAGAATETVEAEWPPAETGELDRPLAASVTREVVGPRAPRAVPLMEDEDPGPAPSLDRDYIDTVCGFVAEAAEGLHHAHTHGIVHRDVKPSNLLVESSSGRVLVTDFGLARESGDDHLTQTGQLAGTPAYMSPEQIEPGGREVERRSDVYSLGVTLYELLTHRLPFRGRTAQELSRRILEASPVPPRKLNPRLSRDLETIVLKAMDPVPEKRYASALEMAEDLRAFLALEPIVARPLDPFTRAVRFVRRRRTVFYSLLAALAALLLVAVVVVAGRISTSRAIARHVSAAATLRNGKEFGAADEMIVAAEELDATSPRVKRARAELEVARARDHVGESDLIAARVRELEDRIAMLRLGIEDVGETVAPEETTYERAAAEETKDRLTQELTNLDRRIDEALNHAERADPALPDIPEVRAEALFLAARDARDRGQEVRFAYLAGLVSKVDRTGRYEEELAGRGTLAVTTDPPGAEVRLYRHVSSLALPHLRGKAPRLVPVPCREDGSVIEPDAGVSLLPGALALRVVATVAGGCAERIGLGLGDLVVGVEDLSMGDTLVAGAIAESPVFLQHHLRPLDRLLAVDGSPVTCLYDFERVVGKVANAGRDLPLDFLRGEEPISVTVPLAAFGELLRIRPCRIDRALSEMTPGRDVELRVLTGGSRGRVSTVVLPAGRVLGATLVLTASPHVPHPESRLGTTPLLLDALPRGSYLAVCGLEGREPVTCPVEVDFGVEASIDVDLFPVGTTPPGFVRIPGGKTLLGGDPEAIGPRPEEEVHIGDFFLARDEVTWGEYMTFVRTAKRLRRDQRDDLCPDTADWDEEPGAKNEHRPPYFRQDDHPLYAVTIPKAEAYVAWLNSRHEDSGIEYFLPSAEQWEKAARGVDGRVFPWGDAFSFHHCKGLMTRPEFNRKIAVEPVGSLVLDESPYGVRDLAGGVREWTASFEVRQRLTENLVEVKDHLQTYKGGSYMLEEPSKYRAASDQRRYASATTEQIGFRVAARRKR